MATAGWVRSVIGAWALLTPAACADAPARPAAAETDVGVATSTTDASASTGDLPGSDGSSTERGSEGAGGSGGHGVVERDMGVAGGRMPPPWPTFTDVTIAAGVDYVQGIVASAPDCLVDQLGPGTNGYCTPERMIAGAAVGDVDGDGDDDLLVTRTRAGELLFRNDGDGSFTDITESAGLVGFQHGAGAVFGDIDNDGDQDLFVPSIATQRYALWINDGSGHFVEEGLARGVAMADGTVHTAMSASFGDYDLDGFLDLYVTEWRSVDGLGPPPSHSRLLRNLGASAPGFFEDTTLAAGVDVDWVWQQIGFPVAGTFSFSPAFVDLDGDRFPELTIVSDFHMSRLFWNDGDGTFTDGTAAAGLGVEQDGMGSCFGDYDADGDLDWYLTSISALGNGDNRMFRNDGGRVLTEVAAELGIADNGWGWGTLMLDPNNDGDLDLLAVAGYYFTKNLDDPIRLWSNEGEPPFVDVAGMAGFGPFRQRRGVLTFDYDADGDLDLFVANNADGPELYRNEDGNEGDWLRVRAVGTTSNADGIGARVTVRAEPGGPLQIREIGSAGHYMGQSERVAHFGIPPGAETVHEVRVYWPVTDVEQELHDVARNATLVFEEP